MIGDELTDCRAIATMLAFEFPTDAQNRPLDGIEAQRRLLRTVGHALRHDPETHFLEMDADGWVDHDVPY
jgi:RNA:NAD 2'-phosphotransferase (TPT1/KptA family)